MTKLFKSQLYLLFAFGFLLLSSQAAGAQSFTTGDVRIGPNGPVGTLSDVKSSGVGSVGVGPNGVSGSFSNGLFNGNVNMGANGTVNGAVNANTNLGAAGFSMNGLNGTQQFQNPNLNGFQGQQNAYNGPGSFGTAYSSQGATGDFGRESNPTNPLQAQQDPYPFSYPYSPTLKTKKQDAQLYERMRNNLLSTFSVDPSPFPSGSFTYGFPTNTSVPQSPKHFNAPGWFLPPTSTSSVDINIVSP